MALQPTDFKGAIAVVTGAGSGLGAALAKAFARAGAGVALADLDEAAAASVAAELSAATGARAEPFRVEVGDRASAFTLAAATDAALGSCSVLCVNVAVVQLGPSAGLAQ
eukprot:SAG31_NODE_4064_length_3624_cov_2.236312_1_plen_110_part_00